MIETAYCWLYSGLMLVLMLLTLGCLVRAIQGPRVADRVVSINMISTLIIAQIMVLSVMKGEGYLADVGMVYALLGFLAVVVLCKIYIGVYLKRAEEAREGDSAGKEEQRE